MYEIIIGLCLVGAGILLSVMRANKTRRQRAATAMRSANIEREHQRSLLHRPAPQQREAYFPSRPAQALTCPYCGTVQRADRALCYHCGAGFVFGDEAQALRTA